MKTSLTRKRLSTAVDLPITKKQKILSTREIPWSEQQGLGGDFVEVGEGNWPVLRIIAERGKKNNPEYLIEWRPHPLTNEEFPSVWRHHSNVADALIENYKSQKKNHTPPQKRPHLSRIDTRARRNRPIIPSSSEDIEQHFPGHTDASLSPPSLGRSDSPASAVEIAETQYPVTAEPLLVNLPPLPKDTLDYETLQTSQFSPSNVDIALTSPLIRNAQPSSHPAKSSSQFDRSVLRSSRSTNNLLLEITPNQLRDTPTFRSTQSGSSTNSSRLRKRSRLQDSPNSSVQSSERIHSSTANSLQSALDTTLRNVDSTTNSGPSYISSSPVFSRGSLRLSSPFRPTVRPTDPIEDLHLSSSASQNHRTRRPEIRKSKRLSENSVIANSGRRLLRPRAQNIESLFNSSRLVDLEGLEIMTNPTTSMEVTTAHAEPVSLAISSPIQNNEDVPETESLIHGNEDITENEIAYQANQDNVTAVSGHVDPSTTIHESIEEELPSSADTSQLLESQMNSSQESLNNERQVETVDGIMIPTHPIFGQNEYAIPLPAEGKTKSAYEELIKLKKKSIIKFIQRKGSPGSSEISSKKTIERNEMQELLQRLNDTVTHSDLGLDPQSQHSLNSQGNASYAEYAGSKFVMLGYLVDRLKAKDCSLIIFTRPGELLELIFAYLKMKGVIVHRHRRKAGDEATQNNEAGSGFTVELLATQSAEEAILSRSPRLIVAFDISFSMNDPQLKEIQRQFGGDIPIIHFLVTNSSEHVEKCVPETLTSNIRLKVVVRTTFLAAANLGGDITYVPDESDRPADGRSMDMGDLQRAVRKSPARRLALIADILTDAALSTDFQSKWTFEGMPELKLSEFNTPPRTSRAVSRTPRTPRAGTPLSRATTPMGRKRLLEVDGENGTKRQRLTPVGDGILESRSGLTLSDEVVEARRHTSDLIAQLATIKAALAVAEQKQSSAQDKAAEWEASLSELQRRFEKHSTETKQLRKENKRLNTEISALRERDEKAVNEKGELRRQISELKSELNSARNDLKTAGGDVAALEGARETARSATAKLVIVEKSLSNTKSDLEFTRERYQDASKSAADSAIQIKDLEAEIEKLKLAANDGKRSLKAMNYETSLHKSFARAEQFKLEVRNREVIIKKLQEENASLKTRRGVQTRGSSAQPAGSPAPRSRQASPAAGHLMPHTGSRASVLRNER